MSLSQSNIRTKPIAKSSEIRLIKLCPLNIEDGPREDRAAVLRPIYVEVVHAALEEAPYFEGVSHT